MSLVVWDNFSYQGRNPLDSRMLFDTIAAMKNYSENYLPDITLAFNKADSKMYVFNRENEVDTTTGKWREFESGEGAGKDSDIAFTTINMTGREVTFNNEFITNNTLVSYTITSGGIPSGTLTASVDTGSVTFESTESESNLQFFVKFEKTNSNSTILS